MAEDPHRVVVTGVGAITAAGPTALDFWTALLDARCCATPLETAAAERSLVAGQIADYAGPPGVPERFSARLSRPAQLALDATIQAIADARIRFNSENAFHVGAVLGTAHGSAAAPASGWPFLSSGLAGSTVGLNIAGPSSTVSADGASGLIAIQYAARLIRDGVISVAVAGGAEAPLHNDVWTAYAAAGLLSSQADARAHRPFDLLRDGMILGEGAGIVVLEERELAVTRGAHIYAELAGGGSTAGPAGDGRPPTDVDIAR
ncbi:MAG: beta-ketoacyl synthase N-terminal-like domain-containing protein, partial [Dehalococcoidia bacterium]